MVLCSIPVRFVWFFGSRGTGLDCFSEVLTEVRPKMVEVGGERHMEGREKGGKQDETTGCS